MAKDYIEQSFNDKDYNDLINSNPISIFDSIDEKKLDIWQTLLNNICPLTFQYSKEIDQDILAHPLYQTGKQKNVISNDAKRTRVRESVLYPNFIETLEKVLK